MLSWMFILTMTIHKNMILINYKILSPFVGLLALQNIFDIPVIYLILQGLMFYLDSGETYWVYYEFSSPSIKNND